MVDSIEVWNSAVWPKNANAIMIWDDMLSSERKLNGRGGSDSHHGVRVKIYGALDHDGQMNMMMGDNAKAQENRLNSVWQHTGNTVAGASYTVRVVKDGNPFSTLQAAGNKTTTVEFTDTPIYFNFGPNF
jgi:hypothetical protein